MGGWARRMFPACPDRRYLSCRSKAGAARHQVYLCIGLSLSLMRPVGRN